MHLRNVSTFFQEEIFSATPSTPHPPRSSLLLSPVVRAQILARLRLFLGVSSPT